MNKEIGFEKYEKEMAQIINEFRRSPQKLLKEIKEHKKYY